jgi:16S rRNA (guanine527-N7)-methyltransferase
VDVPLKAGLTQLGLELNDAQRALLLAFIALLEKWNRAYNLTAITESEQMLAHHLLDSLSISAYLKGTTVLDIGAGAGLPGIPLAIAHPEKIFTLLDSNGKKTRFMQQAALELGLKNVEICKCRVEEYRPGRAFDTVTSRAFGKLAAFIALAAPLCDRQGRLLAMKGRYPRQELEETDLKGFSWEVRPLQVPDLNAERHLVCLEFENR